MISTSSVVIAAWRWRLYWIDSVLIMSPALRVALSIAVIWRAVEAGLVLEQRAIDLDGDVARQQLGEDFLLVGLIFDRRGGDAGAGRRRRRRGGDRDDLVDRRLLHQRRPEVGVGEVDDVDCRR